jgi:glycosyltransferase involved in cell wall biosynthesis
MLPYLNRQDVSILIVGDGDGREHLQRRVPDVWRDRVVFTGRVPEDEVVRTLNAMDVGFIAQTLDKLGRYRLTTKLPEYLASGLPVAMSPVPGFFDYAHAAGWALPPHHPASEPFHRKCAAWIDRLSWSEIKERRQAAPSIARTRFAYEIVRPRFEAFIKSLLESAEP